MFGQVLGVRVEQAYSVEQHDITAHARTGYSLHPRGGFI